MEKQKFVSYPELLRASLGYMRSRDSKKEKKKPNKKRRKRGGRAILRTGCEKNRQSLPATDQFPFKEIQ